MKISKKILSIIMVLLLVVGIVPTSVITVFAASMTVNVEMPSGETVTLDVEPADSIENVKQKMQDKTGLKPETISLYFEDKLLEDGRTLADYNIQSGSKLKLTLLTAEDAGETYTLTIKYAITSSNGVEIGNEIADEQITNISPDTVMDLSDYWPGKMSVVGADGETYYFSGFVENSNGDGVLVYSWKIDGNKTLYAGWTFDSEISISFNTNGGTLDFKAIRYAKKFANIERMNRRFAPVRDGYKFLGWSLDDDGTADEPDIDITEDCTLYAVWGHSHCVCGGNTDIGDHTAHTDVEFTPWNKTDSMPNTVGNYVLMNDVTLSNNWEPADGTVLCLNGHTLSAPVIDVRQNRKFTLCDCGDGKITVGEGTSPEMIYLYADSTFNMYGGVISGGNNRRGVCVSNAWFNMYSGCITDNSTEENGAGVYLYNVAKMTMYGGTITDNYSTQGTGGGVWSDNTASITISGDAVITNNTGKDGTNNLHLASDGTTDAKITVGTMGTNASVGVSVDDSHGTIISDGGKDYADKFFSDNGAYAIVADNNNLKLVEAYVQVGQVTLKNGEYTTNGTSKIDGEPTGTGYAYFKNGVLTLNNFTYSGGSVNSNPAIGSNLAAIFCEYDLTIKVEGRNSITRVVTDADISTTATLRGIWNNGDLKIAGDSRDDILKVTVSGHNGALANAVESVYGSVIIENCTLEAKSVTGGYALIGNNAITITRAKVVGSSGIADDSRSTFGIYTVTLKITDSDIVGIAENNSGGIADRIRVAGSNGKLIFESGSIIGKTSDISGDSYAIRVGEKGAVLPAKYWMRTSASGDFAEGTWDGANVGPYFELTTTEPHIHSYTRKTNDTQHWMECVCGTVQDGSLEDHKGGTATCTAKAKCSECGEEYGDYGAHNWDADWTTDSEKHWHKCLNTSCTEIKDDNLHSGGTATCKDLAKCEFCDMAYGELGAHGDTEVKDKKDATCTEKGYTGDIWCTDCNTELEPGTEIAAAGHDYADGKCKVCGTADPNYKPDTPDSPQTGDNSNMALWLALLFISGLGIVGTTIYGSKRRTN